MADWYSPDRCRGGFGDDTLSEGAEEGCRRTVGEVWRR